ncbi:MAG TPA: hypothetical protein VK074_02115, partial [Fodinibius sp.]|nr:hypothetical protein [Fodinibius sp.]
MEVTDLHTARHQVGYFEQLPTRVQDLRNTPPDLFEDVSHINWSSLKWDNINRPYKVDRWAEGKKLWEEEHGKHMPVKEGWEYF